MAHKVEQTWDRPERGQVIRHQVVRDLYDRSRPAIVVMLVMLGVIRGPSTLCIGWIRESTAYLRC